MILRSDVTWTCNEVTAVSRNRHRVESDEEVENHSPLEHAETTRERVVKCFWSRRVSATRRAEAEQEVWDRIERKGSAGRPSCSPWDGPYSGLDKTIAESTGLVPPGGLEECYLWSFRRVRKLCNSFILVESLERERDDRTENVSFTAFDKLIIVNQSFTWRIRWAEPRSPDAWAGSLWTDCFLEDSWFPSPRTRSWGPFPDPESDGNTDLKG